MASTRNKGCARRVSIRRDRGVLHALFRVAIVAIALGLPVGPAIAAEGASTPGGLVSYEASVPRLALVGIPFEAEIKALDGDGHEIVDLEAEVAVEFSGRTHPVVFTRESRGTVVLSDLEATGTGSLELRLGGNVVAEVRCLPGIVSILPPLLAIVLAFLLRQVVIALLAGIWLGAVFTLDGNLLTRSLGVVDTYVVGALADGGRASIIVFTMLLGGMVGVMTRSGGTRGIVEALSLRAASPRAGQLTTWILGLVVFFDDYANTLIVGNTMRPVTDRLKISREKLAYIVDSTAAPVSSIALISTWIGTEVGLIASAQATIPEEYRGDPYGVFLASIAYRFYPILALVMGFLIAFTGRDFFSMARAEKRARAGKLWRDDADLALKDADAVEPDPGVPCRWYNAVLPILAVIIVTAAGLYVTGVEAVGDSGVGEGVGARMRAIIGSADSNKALLWSSFSGAFLAVVLALSQRLLSVSACMRALTSGFQAMLPAILILVLAWAISKVTQDLLAAPYLVSALKGILSPRLLPVLVFVTAGVVSFATGTSWGTMGILMPLVVPLAHGLAATAGLEPDSIRLIILGAVSSVLSGAVFGDHCSPISDTTIMSSMASGCDHLDHVRTQLPYALVVGIVGMVVGDIPTAFGLSPWIALILGTAVLVGVVLVLGTKVDETPSRAAGS